ncbi:hypothetical protein F9278_32315 [Streptomyces phaeolivaceus]|uniref:Uncharacterized protein n=1 Tax=Streptomyces phaeolivaceus TaxID=2653200 RepID=A0A5P8KAP0_9ACTN|nr:hypothetical protein [Streptomyces phaeolivaceus]QFR00067.1 hypothetical protein F9278_32315 [Streptomyces phaeolivaceus]
MLNLTVRALAWVLSILLSTPPGRHRAVTPSALHRLPPTAPVALAFTGLPNPIDLIDGSASPLVRPYLLTPDERRRQRERRRALYLATLGIDTDPDHIHGIRVGAAR